MWSGLGQEHIKSKGKERFYKFNRQIDDLHHLDDAGQKWIRSQVTNHTFYAVCGTAGSRI